MKMIDIIRAYTNGEKNLVETNIELERIGAGFYLDINKHILTEDEIKNGTAGLMDSGTGTMDKVQIDPVKMELVNADMGDAFALCIIGGKTYEVKGKKLFAY